MAAWLASALVAQQGGAEAVEIGRHNSDLLPGGKEADGILGDFVLRNDRIHALISGNLRQRKANMMHDRYDVIPGTLFDLDVAGAGNDQITSFRPGHLSGPVSYVRIVSDGSGGVAEIETVRTAARGDGLYQRHVYRLEPGWQHVRIVSTFHNQSGKAAEDPAATGLEIAPGIRASGSVFENVGSRRHSSRRQHRSVRQAVLRLGTPGR